MRRTPGGGGATRPHAAAGIDTCAYGGGVLLLPVFTALFGLHAAVLMLTLTQLSSNCSRVWLNRRELHWRLIGWFALGAIPCAVAGGLLLATAPLSPLKRPLGAFLIAVVIWRRLRREPRKPTEPAFARGRRRLRARLRAAGLGRPPRSRADIP
jgi:uncharacterized membrane protein YfcA